MTYWGFSMPKPRVIDYDSNSKDIANYVLERVPDYGLCIGCGACTASCTASNLTDFNIRKIQMLMKRGEIDMLHQDIQKCMLCGKCQLVCPRGVNTRNMIMKIQEAIQIYRNDVL